MTIRILCLIGILLTTSVIPALAWFIDPMEGRMYAYKDQPRPWTERPPVPENDFWGFVYASGTSHAKSGPQIELQSGGKIRVWTGSGDFTPERVEVLAEYVGPKYTTVIPGTKKEKIVYANYSWGYDDHGILTIYGGKDGERLNIAWKLFRIAYNPDNDQLQFFGYGPTDSSGDMAALVWLGPKQR